MPPNYPVLSEYNPELPSLDAFPEVDDVTEQVLAIRAQQSDEAFRRAAQDNLRLERLGELQGVTVPPPQTPWWQDVVESIQKPLNFVEGVGAKIAGVPEFSDLDLIAAGKKGIEEKLRTADILQRKGLLNDLPGTRALAGFFGDIAVDPISWIAPGATSGIKFGGRGLSKLGEHTLERIASSGGKSPELMEKLAEQLRTAGNVAEEGTKLQRALRASPRTAKGFEEAGLIAKGETQLASHLTKEQALAAELGLAKGQSLKDLFEKPAIRLMSPFSGIPGFSQIPIVGKEFADIPVVTNLSREAYRHLGDALYTTNLKAGSLFKEVLRKANQSDSKMAKMAGTWASLVASIPRHLSQNFMVGGKARMSRIREQDISRGAIYKQADSTVEKLFGDMPDDVLEQGSLMYQAGLREATEVERVKVVNDLKARGLKADANSIKTAMDEEAHQVAVKSIVNRIEQMHPGKGYGQKMLELFNTTKQHYDDFGRKEQEAGILQWARGHYLNQAYSNLAEKGVSSSPWIDAQKRSSIGMGVKDFSLRRTYETLGEAAKTGLNPVLNLKTLYKNRLVSHEMAMSALRFGDRMRFEFGIPLALKQQITEMLASENDKVVQGAVDFATSLGLRFDKGDANQIVAAKLFRGAPTSPIMRREGAFTRSQNLSALENESISDFSRVKEIAEEQQWPHEVETLGTRSDGTPITQLRFPDSFKQSADALASKADEYRTNLTGRLGELLTDRAATGYAPDPILNYAAKHMPEGLDKAYYSNLLPSFIVDGLHDMLDTRKLTTRLAQEGGGTFSKGMAKFMEDIWQPLLRAHRYMTTIPWFAYGARNFTSIFPMRLNALSTIGEAMNVPRLIENQLIKNGKRILETVNGVKYTGAQIEELLRKHEVPPSKLDALDITGYLRDTLQIFRSDKAEAAKIVGKSKFRPLGMMEDMSRFIEKVGREHTFIDLLRKGQDPATAAGEVARIFTDYAHGKTKFERDVMNNLFFFYSFGKAQTANTLASFITRPGAITGQLSMKAAVAKAFEDYEDPPLPPDVDEQLRTLKAHDVLSEYIGRDKKGLPEFMTSFGLPMEEVGRWMNFVKPDKWSDALSLADAMGENAGKVLTSAISQMAPPLKGVIELAISKQNTYFDKPITDRSFSKIGKWALDLPRVVAAMSPGTGFNLSGAFAESLDEATRAILQPVDNGDGTVSIDPYALAILSAFVPGAGRAMNTSAAMGRRDVDTSKKVARLLSGVRTQSIDVEKSAAYERRKDLETTFERKGVAKTIKAYQTKQLIESAGGDDDDDDEE